MGLFKSDPQAADRKALDEALEELKARPADVRILMRAAELQHKLGLTSEAVASYARAAERYAEEGFLLKAIAVNKIAFGLVGEPALLEKEAAFYGQLDLVQDAFDALKRAIELHEQRGDKAASGAARRRLLSIDPENAAGHVATAEQLVVEGKLDQAVDELSRVAVQLHLQGNSRDRDRVNARAAYLKRIARGAAS